jgi:hypothetical protein
VLGQPAAGSRKVSGGGNQIHERPMTSPSAVLPKAL